MSGTITRNPASARAGTWWRHKRPVSGKPCSSTTGGPSPVTSYSIPTPPASTRTANPAGSYRLCTSASSGLGAVERQPDVEGGSAGNGLELDRAAEALGNDPPCGVQAQPRALADVLGGEERVKHPVANVVRNSRAVVDDVDPGAGSVARRGDLDRARVTERF